MSSSIYFIAALLISLYGYCHTTTDEFANSTDLNAIVSKDELLFIHTINGAFYAVHKDTGIIKWSFKEDDVIKFPKNDAKPYFLTDPRDGSLYVIHQREGLKKFPYTIPELVNASPSKSSDGYLYTGDKHDQWIAIDITNGAKLDALTSDTLTAKITKSDENILFLGRTKYIVSMFDMNTRKKKFNLTYYDYATHATSIDSSFTDQTQSSFYSTTASPSPSSVNDKQSTTNGIFNYPNYHFTSSSDGLLLTLDKTNGNLLWHLKLDTPIIAIYRYQNEQLYKLNFAIFSHDALKSLLEESWRYKLLFSEHSIVKDSFARTTFTPTLYVGYHGNNLYALPSFVFNTQISNSGPAKLIEGPKNEDPKILNKNDDDMDANINDSSNLDDNSAHDDNSTNKSFLGHHRLPSAYKPSHIKTDTGLVIADKSNDYFQYYFTTQKHNLCPADTTTATKASNATKKLELILKSNYLWSFCTIILASLFPLAKIIYDRYKNKKQANSESNRSSSTASSKQQSTSLYDTNDSFSFHSSYSCPEIRGDGLIKIGKILYDPKAQLGHGCEGTFVYKGSFENRPVAVKRLLPECYTLADREVELLRDADQHANVLRYFCTESDAQFRYIALELCQATLQDYVHRIEEFENKIKPLSVLEQATNGLAHLHSLDIVHRDIKPHNVLLSFPNNKGDVVAMISDFGLCKRLDHGATSYSKRSGATGTEGWIAPELLDDDIENRKRFTKSIDIFSLGCVYYYVLTYGDHPFGHSIRRQANILSNNYKLDKLLTSKSDTYMQRIIIEKMISNDSKQRPQAKELLLHPIFWSKSKTLQFIQDVSDRIEKIELNDPIIIALEQNANVAIKNNWRVHICAELQNDLKKFRSYNGTCVRDLLRAIRNKKHHYRELSDPVKQSLGTLPDEFIDYFTIRFPKLILHTYEAIKCCKDEPMLDVYYKDI